MEGRKRIFGVESKNTKFLFISNLQTCHCNLSNFHSANIIVSGCILFRTLFDDLDV